MTIHLILGLIKKTLYKMTQYFLQQFKNIGGNINVKLNLSNYATKSDLKNIAHVVDTSNFVLKANLASLKTEVNKLDIDKLLPVPVDLSKFSNVVKNEVVEKTVYDKLAAKVNNIDTSGFILKTKYDADKLELEKKNPDVSNVVKKSDYNAKVNGIEGKMPSISELATTSALTVVENKIPSISALVKKAGHDATVNELEKKFTNHKHAKYINTPEFNKLITENFAARLAQANLITKTDFDAKLSSLDKKITSNKIKHLLFENEMKNLKTFDLSYFIGKTHFDEDRAQNYFIFQSKLEYFTLNSNWITKWNSKGLSDESLEVIFTSDNTLTPSVNYY